MATRYVPVPVQGGGSSAAGILLLLVAIVGLVALFSGNLDRWIAAVAGPAGGAEGLSGSGSRVVGGSWGEPTPAPATRPAGSGGAQPR